MQVDDVNLHPLQTDFALFNDPLRRSVVMAYRVAVPVNSSLGRDHHIITTIGNHFTDQNFALPVSAVTMSRVQKVDS